MVTKIYDFCGNKASISVDRGKLCRCHWIGEGEEEVAEVLTDASVEDSVLISTVEKQLKEYFEGDRKEFELPLELKGTPFQKQVWEELKKVPHGTTISYGELSRRIGNPKAVRAVAQACGANPIAIIVPCHRIIATSGKPGGYAGGKDLKTHLLHLETL